MRWLCESHLQLRLINDEMVLIFCWLLYDVPWGRLLLGACHLVVGMPFEYPATKFCQLCYVG
ncbi:hypothetical protein COLO4_35864 [Corchorus olitorius]|uniref:Uncharacterized protein n=1 Tax=Corchorus olitorius TaxID=93759 RepID=A0A1R3GCL6_9ROSI|nr:hypothetical protein COLO4_35864 [Corchorus olitorius]